MRGLAIGAVGAFSSVGLNAPQTMSSLQARMQRFEALEVEDEEGEPITGAPTPLPREVRGAARLVAMAQEALAECARGWEREPAPVLLCCPDGQWGAPAPEEVLDALAQEAGVLVHRRLSRVFVAGHAAVVEALQEARRLFHAHEIRTCYLGGVDSLVEPDRLAALVEQDRVKRDGNPFGIIPGEGAAFLRLELVRNSAPRPCVEGLGLAKANELGAGFSGGFALERALKAALADAGAEVREAVCLAHDGTGQRRPAQDLAVAVARLGVAREQAFDLWDVATCVGETGAAAGPLSIGYFAFAMGRGRLAPGALFSGSSENGLAGAVFVRAPREKEEVHHGR
jgi:3-oxoacyl-[acyl-carrier-protein] synthase-1